MYAGKLNVLHYGRNEGMCAIAYGIGLTLEGVVKETVNEDRAVRCYTDSSFHIVAHALVIIYHFHSASAKNV